MSRLLVCMFALCVAASGRAESGFQFRQSGASGLELTENGKPVLLIHRGIDDGYG